MEEKTGQAYGVFLLNSNAMRKSHTFFSFIYVTYILNHDIKVNKSQFEGSNGRMQGLSGAGAIEVDSASAIYAPHMTDGALKVDMLKQQNDCTWNLFFALQRATFLFTEVTATPASGSEPARLTYKTVGGILDFYVFTGPTPSDVVSQYLNVIGLPYMPPYWGLGFHLCRWGYKSSDNMKAVIKRMRDGGFPYVSIAFLAYHEFVLI